MNGLSGRLLRLPPKRNNKEILMVYGHHSSIERWWGLAQDLNKYGAITMPDLPGFGGMQTFYKIGDKPTLDNMADYLAAFMKLFYKRRRVTIVGMSFGFLVVTRMLQKHPSLTARVDMVISLVGFAHYQDFRFTRSNYLLMRYGASFFSNRLPAAFGQYVCLRGPLIRAAYGFVADRHSKLKDADKQERKQRIKFEIGLWQCNDLRTYMDTTVTMLCVDLCNKQVPLPVYHVTVAEDRYFDHSVVEQHLGVVYNQVYVFPTKMKAHAPTVIADVKGSSQFMPAKLRRILSQA